MACLGTSSLFRPGFRERTSRDRFSEKLDKGDRDREMRKSCTFYKLSNSQALCMAGRYSGSDFAECLDHAEHLEQWVEIPEGLHISSRIKLGL